MPSSISIPSSPSRFLQFPSKPRKNSNYSSKFKVFSFSLTSSNPEFQLPFSKLNNSSPKSILPIVIKRNGKDYKYYYDNNSLELVCDDYPDGSISLFHGFENGFRKFVGIVADFFIPKNVSHNYIDYVKWKFLHRVFSSALQVLATQAMFRAIGVGYAQSLPSAAALNWVLKDGLGRLSRCIYTACVGSAFDTNLKRVRFATSVMFSLSIGVELMTPAFPNCFLLLASVANVAKQISLACYLATGTAVHRSFALADNVGEVSAKAQIQTVCFDTLGLLLAASLNLISRNNQRLQVGLPFVVYPIFSAIDLCGIYQSLKHVHLQTLTKDRLEIILNTWIQCRYVPSPAEVSKLEGINLFEGRKKRTWPVRIGCLDPKRQVPFLSMLTMTSLSAEDYYFICLEPCSGLRKSQYGILLALREGAGMKDVIMGMLQACYIRKAILSRGETWANIAEASDVSHTISRQWFDLLRNSKHSVQNDLNLLQDQIMSSSWAAKNVLLSTQEQTRFDFVDDR
ncbi:protein root UVB sensitive 4-like isoform X2 [Silene latifolia]|uniref:protein root UVB sensitive 4-like isoform X2 n=1 Tax=Silene latifolia TaxID=37657 RepID=UPI003D77B542